jgi:hypothetical protein
MHRLSHQFLAGAGLTLQQHRGFGGRHAQNLGQHAVEAWGTPHHSLRRRLSGGLFDHLHGLDEIQQLPVLAANRCRLHGHMLLAARRVMQVQHAPGLTALLTQTQWTGFARLITGHGEVVGDLITVTAGHWMILAEFAAVGPVGGNDAVARIHDDAGLGLAVEEGEQLGQGIGHRNHVRMPLKCH